LSIIENREGVIVAADEAVIVTGGAGFVGAYATRALLAAGHRVLVYDLQPKGNVLDLLLPEGADGLAVETVEITDGWLLLDLCLRHGIGAAVHLASPLTKDVAANPPLGIRDICSGTATVFAAAREAGLKRVVWASSVAVFGPQSDYPFGPLPDDAFHRPVSLYGSCKSLCETLAREAHAADGLDVTGLRLSVVYGAGRLRGYMSDPSHLMRDAAAGTAVHAAYGRQRLHWQHVEEVTGAVVAVLASGRTGEGRTYNVPGDCRSWREAAEIIQAARPEVAVTIGDEADPALAGVVADYDAHLLARDFGYQHAWPLERGIRHTLDAYDAMRTR
jgi:nucleoside-diphosphate-sugar epimerase